MHPIRRIRSLRSALLATIGALALVSTTFVGTAGATGKGQEHRADRPSATDATEDDDTNDGGTKNNVTDDGDNEHPSGKDRSVEPGRSGNQGKATSDPDDDGRGPDRSNGGPDKPDGSGGVDQADQDGNNGCGNDDDFEDDNEGWCGQKPKTANVEKDHGRSPSGNAAITDDGSCFSVSVSSCTTSSAAESCPLGMVDTNGSAAGCGTPQVLGAAATASCPMTSVARIRMPVGCYVPFGMSGAVDLVDGEVRSAGAAAAAPASVSVRSAAPARVVGSLASTGVDALTLLVVALLAIVIGRAILRAGRSPVQA